MNILYTLDNNFISQVAASICSVCENNKEEKIKFFIFSEKISDQNKQQLNNFVMKYNQEISIIEIGDLHQYFDFDFDTLGWNSVVLARLLCDKILPQSIEKILYLDGDTIVLRSLKEVWATDLTDYPLAACIEPTVDSKRKHELNMDTYPYFNSGVLLINLKLCRENDIFPKIIEYYKENDGRLFAPDQDAINGYLKGKIAVLPPKYNFANTYIFYPYKTLCKISGESGFVDKETYRDSINNPTIIHYLGEERPWRIGNEHNFKDEFIKYANMTPWGVKEEKGWNTYFRCWNLFNIVMKYFPYLRYCIINSLIPMFMKYRKQNREKKNAK